MDEFEKFISGIQKATMEYYRKKSTSSTSKETVKEEPKEEVAKANVDLSKDENIVTGYRVITEDVLKHYMVGGDPSNIPCAEAQTFFDNIKSGKSSLDYESIFDPKEKLLHLFEDKESAIEYFKGYEKISDKECTIVECKFPEDTIYKSTGFYEPELNGENTREMKEFVVPLKNYNAENNFVRAFDRAECGVKTMYNDPDDYSNFNLYG